MADFAVGLAVANVVEPVQRDVLAALVEFEVELAVLVFDDPIRAATGVSRIEPHCTGRAVGAEPHIHQESLAIDVDHGESMDQGHSAAQGYPATAIASGATQYESAGARSHCTAIPTRALTSAMSCRNWASNVLERVRRRARRPRRRHAGRVRG